MKNTKIKNIQLFSRFSLISKGCTGVFILLFTLTFILESSAQRDVVWLGGMDATSHRPGFVSTGQLFENQSGFPMNNLVNQSNYKPHEGVVSSVTALESMISGGSDILGVAHDYGGIILRQLQLDNSNISAIIINGAPNKGSNAISQCIDNGGNPSIKTTAEKLIENIQDIKQHDDCEDCDVIEAFESMVTDIELGASAYEYIVPGGDIDNLGLPTVPTAILWGDSELNHTEEFLTSLMSSNALPVTPFADRYTSCVVNNRSRARTLAKQNFELAALRANNNFYTSLISGLGKFIKELGSIPSPAAVLNFASTFINANVTSRIEEITRVRDLNEELSSLMRCELANQVLAAEWALMVSGADLEIVEEEVEVPNSDYIACLMECEEIEYELGININCNVYCADIPETETETIIVSITQPSDGLYSKTEQSLDNADITVRLALTNHFEETKYLHPSVNQAYTDLFNGSGGAAFALQ